MTDQPAPFPLSWPKGWKRTPEGKRQKARFSTGFSKALMGVCRSLYLHNATHMVISTNQPLRPNGLPYATGGRVDDPGVAVYWVHSGASRAIACDRWDDVTANLQAIHLSLESLRGLDRWGASEIVARAFAGFKTLPSSNQFDQEFESCASQEDAKAVYRRLMREHHPDLGGSQDRAIDINQAFEDWGTRQF